MPFHSAIREGTENLIMDKPQTHLADNIEARLLVAPGCTYGVLFGVALLSVVFLGALRPKSTFCKDVAAQLAHHYLPC
jgi:hypothetical protein